MSRSNKMSEINQILVPLYCVIDFSIFYCFLRFNVKNTHPIIDFNVHSHICGGALIALITSLASHKGTCVGVGEQRLL